MNASRPTLLLVEDDDDARASLERTLDRAGYFVLGANDVTSALHCLEQGAVPSVVVSDMVLGKEEAGGICVLNALRDRLLFAPVILITAFASLENVKHGLNEGAAFLLEKPFRAADLLAAIVRVSTSRSYMSQVVDRALLAATLTDKEQAIARLVLKGLTSVEIARLQHISDKTVRQHLTRIYQKCNVTSRAEFFNHVFPW